MTARDISIREACQRTLLRQTPNSFAAAFVVTVYMVATALPYTAWPVVAGWATVQVLSQVLRTILYRHHLAHEDDPATLARYARRYTAYMLLAGAIWASTIFLFVRLDAPITLALTLCGLYGISGGSVPGNAYNPPGLYAFVGAIFGGVMIRMLVIGDFDHISLGVASVCYAGILIMFCQVQNVAVKSAFEVQFENVELLAEVTAQKAAAETARAEAEAANLAKSQFLAAASHDLRQPLYALGLFAGALKDFRLAPRPRQIVDRMQGSVQTLSSLFSGLLDISRLDAGAVTPEVASVSVRDLFGRLELYFAGIAEERGLRLRFRRRDAWVASDPVLLERVLSNLIANALRYTETGGVVVAARRRGGRLLFEVWDTGIGIDEADRTRIFDEFVQIGNAERDQAKGFGLGLSIARRTVALLGGALALESRPGRGSVFRFDQPACEPPSPVHSLDTAPQDLLRGLSVLVIDDEATVLEATGLLLARWGVTVRLADGIGQALALTAEGARIDVVLCDYRLRDGVNGFEVMDALAATSSPARFCLVTGDLDTDLVAAAKARSALLVHKPIQPAKLRALLNQLARAAVASPE